jgi:hypothetical protein
VISHRRGREFLHQFSARKRDKISRGPHATDRSDRAMDDVINRPNIEPGVVAVSWEKKV